MARHRVPAAMERIDQCEVLTFRQGLRWSGVGAFIGVVPVPLMMPTGRHVSSVFVREGRVVGTVTEHGEVRSAVGYLCGSNACGFVAGPVNRDAPQADVAAWCV